MPSTHNVDREEPQRLEACLSRLRQARDAIDSELDEQAREIQDRKAYLWDARRDMDHIEKIAVRQTIEQSLDSAQFLQQKRIRIEKLLKSPYFGRFDFLGLGVKVPQAIYVGVHHFQEPGADNVLVHDWRAPVSSMFYDYELGPAAYQAPVGTVTGDVLLKRQFRIRDGRMELMLESGVHIVDDVLQEELGRSAGDEGMKNIVATIQRDQNAIIRDDQAHTIIIQGVAGSGKTSIALHRIAYLLYRFKDTLSSDDILILSPNRVFADYIGNVLPELGEERVTEVGIEDLASELLDHAYRFQTFFEQTTRLLESNDDELRHRIVAKASLDFLRCIERYTEHLESSTFLAQEWRLGRKIVPAWHFLEAWNKHRGVPTTERVNRVVNATEQKIGIHYNYDMEASERKALRDAVRAMVQRTTLREAYRNLFVWMGEPDLFKTTAGKLEYADVFPLIYLKMRLEGIENPRKHVKHLLIDEMQDYTPAQYSVLAKLFTCRKTVLGDSAQSISPYGSSSALDIQRALRGGECVKLTKSYRSTWEITQLAQSVAPNPELEAIQRHGPKPECVAFKQAAQLILAVRSRIEHFHQSNHSSLALIVKTQRQANALHKTLASQGLKLTLLDPKTRSFSTGVLVCTPHLAKGLEFDRVVVADAGDNHYQTELDRRLLYVACTRAMHQLTLLTTGRLSRFLDAYNRSDSLTS